MTYSPLGRTEEDLKTTLNAANSGGFKIAGDLEVHRLGYGHAYHR